MKKLLFIITFLFLFFINVDVFALKMQDVTFSACVDGDTARLILNKKEIKVRFLAIDTPESVHPTIGEEEYGKEASEYTCNKLKKAKKISIEYDPGSDKTDKYDRHLVWIYVDGSLLQKELIKKGYAEVAYLYGDYLYTEELKKEQEKAKSNKIGIWGIEQESDSSLKKEVKQKNKNEYETLIDEIYNILKKICEMLVDFLIDMI